jgi:hypothetical protein
VVTVPAEPALTEVVRRFPFASIFLKLSPQISTPLITWVLVGIFDMLTDWVIVQVLQYGAVEGVVVVVEGVVVVVEEVVGIGSFLQAIAVNIRTEKQTKIVLRIIQGNLNNHRNSAISDTNISL